MEMGQGLCSHRHLGENRSISTADLTRGEQAWRRPEMESPEKATLTRSSMLPPTSLQGAGGMPVV